VQACAPRFRRGGALLSFALLFVACNPVAPGEFGFPSYLVRDWEVVSEQRIDRTHFQYALRGWCHNGGADSASAAGIVLSSSPHTVIVEDQVRCGPVRRNGREPSLDTITVLHDRTQPFDEQTIRSVVLTWGPDTLLGETRFDRTRFDYAYSAELTNLTEEDHDVVATVVSRSPSSEILDDTVTGRVPKTMRLVVTDGFAIRHERNAGYDPNALEWRLRLGTDTANADIDGNGVVDDEDRAQVETCVGADPVRHCACARADLDGDGIVGAADIALLSAQLGRTGLPVRPPDATPPTLTVVSPAPGSVASAAPIDVTGTVDEPLFRLLVNGVPAAVDAGTPPLAWNAQAPLPAGAPALIVSARDHACNESVAHVPLAAGEDRLAPGVRVRAPTQVGAGQALRVVAEASDDVGVVAVELFVDGTTVGERMAPPFVFDIVAPAAPGATLGLRAVARDAAGNTGETSDTVLVVMDGGDAPPELGALRIPPSVAPGAAFHVGAEASDDRGVAELRFSIAGGAGTSALAPPWEAVLVAPADAPVGAQLALTVEAIDGAGQTARAEATTPVVAAADVTPPRVSLEAPEQAVSGTDVRLAASAQDDGGVASVRFLADGILVARSSAPPYHALLPLPVGRAPGEIVVWTAEAVDFAGNTARSAPVVTRVIEPGAGFAVGEVYDDATSRPLAGVRVRALEWTGAPPEGPATPETMSDERGAWRLALPEGPALLELTADGYTRAWRRADVPASGVVTLLDGRLLARAAPVSLERAEGGTVTTPGGGAHLQVAPGALVTDGALALTRLGPQALPLPLPLGWTPLAAFDLDVPAGLAAPVALVLDDDALAAAPVAVRFDAAAGVWRGVAIDRAAQPPRILLSAPGAIALVRGDAGPDTPPIPDPGATLIGVDPVEVPSGASATLLPSPQIVFADPDARADVRARLATPVPLPSGTPIEVQFRERYEQVDGSRVEPPASDQDFLLYAEPEGPLARFVATPLPGLDAALLGEGVIELSVRVRGVAAPRPIGAAGGQLKTQEDVGLEIAPGALAEQTPVAVEALSAAALGLARDERFEVLGGVEIDLAGRSLASTAILRFPLSEPLPAGAQVLLVRPVSVLGRAELELVGVATLTSDSLLVGAGGAGLPLPGIRAGGPYALVRMNAPVGFVTGDVRRDGAPVVDALVRADTLPFVGRTRAGEPRYGVAAALGSVAVSGLDLTSGDVGRAAREIAAAGAVVGADLTLSASRPAVVSVRPADGAGSVPLDAAIVIEFDGPMDRASMAAGFSLLGPEGLRAGALALSADGQRATFRPAAPLAGETEYRVQLAASLRDRFGNALVGNQPDGGFATRFVSADVTPPLRPEAGQTTVGEPIDGVVALSGATGSVEPGMLVSVTNQRTGAVSSVLAGADGSFALSVSAGVTDGLALIVLDEAGNATENLDLGRPPTPEGVAVLGTEGGVVEGADGISALIPSSILPADTVVAIEPLPLDKMPHPFEDPEDGSVAAAVSLSLGGAEIDAPAQLVLEIDGFPQFETVDLLPPLYEIDREIMLPAELPAGRDVVVRVVATGATGVEVSAEAVLAVRAAPDRSRHHERTDGALRVDLELPAEAAPGETIRLVARAEYPDVRLRFPADPSLTGDEQFLLWEVKEIAGRPVWDLVTAAELVTLEDGSRVIETKSPPYRGIRRDTSKLLLAIHTQFLMGFVQMLSKVSSFAGGATLGTTVAMASSLSGMFSDLALGTELLLTFSRPPGVDLNPYEFSVIPVPAGAPSTIEIVDFSTNRNLATAELAALAPNQFSEVLVLGEDKGPLQVAATTSPANHAVPIDASFTLVFSHLIDPATITDETLELLDASGNAVAYRKQFGRTDTGALSVTIFPLARLQPGEQYTLRAAPRIARLSGEGLRVPFEMKLTTADAPEVIGRIALPFAQSFDVIERPVPGPGGVDEQQPLALVTQRASLYAEGTTNRFVSVELADPVAPVLLHAVDIDARHSGPLRAIRGLDDVEVTGRDGNPIAGDLAVVAAGSTDVFSTLRFYAVAADGQFDHQAGVLVSTPTEDLLASADLLVIPEVDYKGVITKIEVSDVYEGLFDGVPKTPAIPGRIDTDGDRTVYFSNYGVGLMTIDVGRAIPPPPAAERGSQLGPSFAPTDKTGALVVRDDGSLLELSPHLLVTEPTHLQVFAAGVDEVEVHGLLGRPEVDRILVNGVEAKIEDPPPGAGPGYRPFEATIRLREGVNSIIVTPFEEGVDVGSGRHLVIRNYASNPLAGPGTVTLDLDPIQVVDGPVRLTATVDDTVRFDAIFVNGFPVSQKQCPIETIRPDTKSCGWNGRGSVVISAPGGVSTISATAVDFDDEGFGTPSFSDLRVSEGLLLAVRRDLFLHDASSLVQIGSVPIGDASRVSVARQIRLDVDGDGRSLADEQTDDDDVGIFEELRNLALVGGGPSGRLVFVDVTEPQHAGVIGSLVVGSPVYRAEVLPLVGTAWIAAGNSVVVADLTRANRETLDENGDGVDDRIIARIELPGAEDIRLDPKRGYAYVLQRDIGIAVLRLADCATDIGIDATRYPVSREILVNDRKAEKNALVDGFLSGMATAACAPFSLHDPSRQRVAIRSQGSSACLWTEPIRCSTAYQPGISDHDFQFLFPASSNRTQATACTEKIQDEIKKKLPDIDLSVFAEPAEEFLAGYRSVVRSASVGCGSGDDPFGDGCLGRNGLMLKWLLEGEWVKPERAPAWDGAIDQDEALRTLRSRLPAQFLKPDAGDHSEPSRVPRLEGYEWAVLQKYRVEETLARLRRLGSSLFDPDIVDPKLHKKLHKVGKAGIRTVLGKLLATSAGNDLILEANRQDYRSAQGCRTRAIDPANVSSIADFRYKPCETFEEYVASQAIESCARGLGVLDCPSEALLAYEFFRIKSDVGPPPTSEGAANAFIARTIRYIDSVLADANVRDAFETGVSHFLDGSSRRQNIAVAQNDTAKFLPGGAKFRLDVPLRVFNRGYGVSGEVQFEVYHQGSAIEDSRIGTGSPGSSHFFAKRVAITPAEAPVPGDVAEVLLRLDRDDEVVEYDEGNNADGFYYYYLHDALIREIADGDGGTTPPRCSGANPAGGVPASPNGRCRPDPPALAALPDPPASAVCLEAGAAPPSPGVELIARVEDVESYAFGDDEETLERIFVIRNTGNVDLLGLVIEDTVLGSITAGDLAVGQEITLTVPLPTDGLGGAGHQMLVSTISGTDADGNGIGVTSTLTRLVAADPEPELAIEPVILIPGMAASRLDAGGEYWPDPGLTTALPCALRPPGARCKERLTLDPDLSQLSIQVPDVMRSVLGTAIYAPLIDALLAAGYQEYPVGRISPSVSCDPGSQATLFVFPYDWRTSNGDETDRLHELVECIQRMHPERRLHIVAHSMGGLLARRYVIDRPGRIAKMITIGSPWAGAPKALSTLGAGQFLGWIQPLFIGAGVLKELSQFFPGAHELMPTRAYFESLDGQPFADPSGLVDYARYRSLHDTVLYPRGRPASNSEAFHDHKSDAGAQDDWRDDRTFAEFFHVYGEQSRDRTTARVAYEERLRPFVRALDLLGIGLGVAAQGVTSGIDAATASSVAGTVDRHFRVDERGPGDGTVPTRSATRKYRSKSRGETTSDNLNGTRAWLFEAPGSDAEREHNGMLGNPRVQQLVLDILKPGDPSDPSLPPGLEAAR